MTFIPNRIDTRISLRCQVVLLFCRAAWAKRGNCLTVNDNLDLWFLVILLPLLCNALIQLIETTQLLGLLRIVANFVKTLNVQINFLKGTNIP